MKHKLQHGAISWALYDWGNSAFATTVIAGFFPVFFKDYWSEGIEATESTFWLGISVTTAGLIVALLAPILGSFADRGAARKKMLTLFAGIGILVTVMMSLLPQGAWPAAAVCYVVSYASWLCSLIFYDSLIVTVSTKNDVDLVSGIGFSLGYLGGGLLFALNVAMTLKPGWFGFADATGAVKASFISVAIWWGLFTLPLLKNVREGSGEAIPLRRAIREGFAQLIDTFHEIRRLRYTMLFLFAYWFYIDGVDTIVTMAVDYGKSIGIQTTDLIASLLLVQFVAFPFAYLFGRFGQKFGAKRFIFLGVSVYIVITIFGSRMGAEPYHIFGFAVSQFFILASFVGTVQGGVQALSRSLFTRLIPESRAAEFFGFYNMVGKFAAIMGPVLMGSVSRITGNPRIGILSVSILFFIGGSLLYFVDEKKGHAMIATDR